MRASVSPLLMVRLLAVAAWLGALAVTAPFARAAAPPVDAGATYTLTGNSAGAVATYAFTVPGDTPAPVVTVTFTPSAIADGSRAGFTVLLDGTTVGSGVTTSTPGVLTYTLPKNPAGTAVVQVFAYYGGGPVGYTISTNNVPAGAPNGPAGANGTVGGATPINGQLSGTLPANTAGSFAYFTFPSAGATPPTTVSLTYSPANALVNQAVGFNVFDAFSNNIGSAIQPADQNLTAATLTLDLSRSPGEPLTIQVFNYAQGVQISYRLSVSGIPPRAAAATAAPASTAAPSIPAGGFQPFWVENFVATPLWSGPDANAVSFGVQPQFSSFLVVSVQTSGRLYVYNPRTRDYAYIDAAAVGPSGPPSIQ